MSYLTEAELEAAGIRFGRDVKVSVDTRELEQLAAELEQRGPA